MSKFKVGDKVRALDNHGWSKKGCIYTVSECWYNPFTGEYYVRLVEHLSKSNVHSHWAARYELVEPDPVLTPEEVFEHLRKGTKLQMQPSHNTKWMTVTDARYATYEDITNKSWRIKIEPEVIELNGKTYREIVE